MTKTYEITNGTKVEIAYNEYMGDYVMHNCAMGSIYGMGRYKTFEEAYDMMVHLADQWGGFTVK